MKMPVNEGAQKLRSSDITSAFRYPEHQALGKYFDRGASLCVSSERRPFDMAGVPMFVYKDSTSYHPVNIAQCGLSAVAYTLAGNDGIEVVRSLSDKLIEMQDERGALTYSFDYDYHIGGRVFASGWTSAMAQAQSISLFARAYTLLDDEKYLIAGAAALDYLLTKTNRGGVMNDMSELHSSLHNYIWFEEYPTNPASYTLNGYMYVLIGLYDWSQLHAAEPYGQQIAEKYFHLGIETLSHVLRYYDAETITTYDLGFLTFEEPSTVASPAYHMLHVKQLHVLYSITGNNELMRYRDKWLSYAFLSSGESG